MTSSSLMDYAPVLAHRDGNGEPFVIVGGHAVNFWADAYRSREPRLDEFYPFLSKDLDLIATTEEGRRVAAALRWEFVPPEPDANVMQGKLRHGALLVELLRSGTGELFPPVRSALNISNGESLAMQLLSPIALFEKKISLAVDVPQDGSIPEIAVRQDVRHVRMLALILPHYTADILANFPDDEARLAVVRPMLAVLASLHRGRTGRRFEENYPGVLPWGKLLPVSVRHLPLDDVYRRCLEPLDGSSR